MITLGRKIRNAFLLFGPVLFLTAFGQNCENAKFTVQTNKSELIAKSRVFAGTQAVAPGTAEGQIPQPSGSAGGSAGGQVGQPPSSPPASGQVGQNTYPYPFATPTPYPPSSGQVGQGTTPPASGKIPVVSVCSYTETSLLKTSAVTAQSLELIITDSNTGSVVCDLKDGVKKSVVDTKTLDISQCNLPGNSYKMKLVDPAHPTSNLFYSVPAKNAAFQDEFVLLTRKDSASPWQTISNVAQMQDGYNMGPTSMFGGETTLGVLYANNPNLGALGPADVPASQCDEVASPLVVDMTPPGQVDLGLMLTSQIDGVLFDILGLNSYPFAHSKKQISWIQNRLYMFLVLPDSRGNVTGVDQLFGNNTFGPDHQFAANGFDALSKYDDNSDDVINEADPIFHRLRLWSDTNGDGIAQPSELHTLEEMKVKEIDLNFDPNYFEQDQYGNQSRLKSAVKMQDKSLRMVFDLWFAFK